MTAPTPAHQQQSAPARARAGVQTAAIPGELRQLPQWVTWIWTGQINPNTGKPNKLPLDAKTGRAASSTDPATWATFDQAVTSARRQNHAGVGFVFTASDPFAGVDLDDCVGTFGIEPWAQEIIDAFATYSEISPSGTGVKLIGMGTIPSAVKTKHIEMYATGRFFTVTGNVWPGTPPTINDISAELLTLHSKLKPPPPKPRPVSHQPITASDPRAQAWAQRVIDYACDQMRQAPLGSKHHTRVNMGRMLGGLVAHGLIDAQAAADLIYYANPPQANDASERKAIMDGVRLGTQTPLDPPPLPASQTPYLVDGHACCPTHLTPLRESDTAGWFCPTQDGAGWCTFWFDGQGYSPPSAAPSPASPPSSPPPPPASPQSPQQSFHPQLLDAPQTDAGNAECFVALYGDRFRYCRNLKQWLSWQQTHWQMDANSDAWQLMLTTIRERRLAAGLLTDPDKAKRLFAWTYTSEMTNKREAALKAASHLSELTTVINDYDRDINLLGLPNGVLDLAQGAHRPAIQHDMITMQLGAAYDLGASCPRWLRFMEEITGGDAALTVYMQRAVGYSLTGSTIEQNMFLLYGDGRNGKSTFLNVLSRLMGDYAGNTAFEMLDAERRSESTSDLAALKGKRFVTIIESDQDRYLAEARVKVATGKDPIHCRFLYCEPFDYYPHFKIWMAMNHLPKIRGTDEGIWRRIQLIPFSQRFADGQQDKNLEATLLSELSGILNWALDGLKQWQRDGLGEPPSVKQATADYRKVSDVVGEFLDEYCVADPVESIDGVELYELFFGWSKSRGEMRPMSAIAFGRILSARGHKNTRKIVKDVLTGLARKQPFYAGLRRRTEHDT